MFKKPSITYWVLCTIIIILMIIIGYLDTHPKVVTQEVEVIKEIPVEVEVEKEIIIEVDKEVVVEKEIVVEVEVEKEPTYVYHVTSAEREMLARLLYREANTEGIECQRAIVSVVINRWRSGIWGKTLKEVIYAPSQFSPAHLIPTTTPTETNYEVVDYILKNGVTLPEYVMYFRLNYHFDWKGYQPYQKIDHTCFGYMTKDKGE